MRYLNNWKSFNENNIRLFKSDGDGDGIVKEYDPREGITYFVDTKRKPIDNNDIVMGINGELFHWSGEPLDKIIGVVISKVDGYLDIDKDPDEEDKHIQVSPVQYGTGANSDKRADLIKIPKVLYPKLECIKDITVRGYNKEYNIKVSDVITLHNYLYFYTHAKVFYIIDLNGEKIDASITLEKLTDHFKLV